MKVITNDSLDSLLSVQISTDGGQSYSTYSVSSLKDGLTLDCSPKDLKVICDVNTLKYIQVLADGEKASSSDIDLSNYIKIKDFYVDVYENPYYGKEELTAEEANKLQGLESSLYEYRQYQYYCRGNDFEPQYWWSVVALIEPSSGYKTYTPANFIYTMCTDDSDHSYYIIKGYFNESVLDYDLCMELIVSKNLRKVYLGVRYHFIKHF